MFTVFLKFSANRAAAPAHMEGHKAWLRQGFDDGVFLAAGSLAQGGGAILAHATTEAELRARLAADPFVEHDVVTVELTEFTPSLTDPRLTFLTEAA
ncbi:YciI family protein [Seohaeicola saemankumensis]|nr:YciI family protein [Seohaeicola saemankumensis]MCA0871688.1 YciI family protein [Seohaeicola saemankumensis]